MKPLDAIGSIDVSSVQQVDRYAPHPREGESIPKDVTPERVGQESEKTVHEKTAERERVKKIADRLNRMSRVFDRRIQFEVPSDSEDVIVKIIDRETGQVIRQIPPPELVKLAKQIDEIYETIFGSKL